MARLDSVHSLVYEFRVNPIALTYEVLVVDDFAWMFGMLEIRVIVKNNEVDFTTVQ